MGVGGSHELFAQDWLQTKILLISASQVARIAQVSHWSWGENNHLIEKGL
jgi:hypothetical protein